MSQTKQQSEFLVSASEMLETLRNSQKYAIDTIKSVDNKLEKIDQIEELANSKWTAVDATDSTKGITKLEDALDSSSVLTAATPKSVKDALTYVDENYPKFSIPLYVDGTNGSDDNNGLSSETPVKTISKAISLANSRCADSRAIVIYVQGGVYDEGVSLSYRIYSIVFRGDVTISNLSISEGGRLYISGSNSSSLTVNTSIRSFADSWLSIAIPVTCDSASATRNSMLRIASTISITNDLLVKQRSQVYITGVNTSVSCSSMTVDENSNCTMDTKNSELTARTSSIEISNNSVFNFVGTVNIFYKLSATGGSSIRVAGTLNTTLIRSERKSNISFIGATANINVPGAGGVVTGTTGINIVYASLNSNIDIASKSTINISGTDVNSFFIATYCSTIIVSSDNTIYINMNGSVVTTSDNRATIVSSDSSNIVLGGLSNIQGNVTGRKYYVARASSISASATKLDSLGTINGIADSGSYGYA